MGAAANTKARQPEPPSAPERLSSIFILANSRAAKDLPLEVRLVADRVGLTGDTHVRTVQVEARFIANTATDGHDG